MMKSILIGCIALLCPFFAKSQSFANAHYVAVNTPECKGIWWVNEELTTFLGYIDSTNMLRMVRTQLDVMSLIDTIVLSPDQTYVLISSSGEGHPYLTVYKLADLFSNEEALPARGSINPYPLWYGEVAWLDNEHILFSSPIDFSSVDPESGFGKYEDGEEKDRWWILSVVSGKIVEKR
jgi:hypothetical protein